LTNCPRWNGFTRAESARTPLVLAEVGLRRGVERLADFDVEVAVHLDPGENRHVIGLWHGEQRAGLALGEHLGRAGRGGAVDARPGDLPAPALRPGLGISQVHELLTGEEVPPNILDTALDSRLVLGVADPGGVGGKPAVLSIIPASPP
jgi:hypothetical protein